MYRLLWLVPAIFVIASQSIAAYASDFSAFSPIAVGYIGYDVTGSNVAEFDIVNFSGANASSYPDMTFPIATPLSLSDLSLTVDFLGGRSEVFNSSYFTLDADGFSFDGKQLSTLSGDPTGLLGATSAILTGMFSTQNLTLNDGSKEQVYYDFSTTLSDPGGLAGGDLAIINATVTPEPATLILLGTALLLLVAASSGRLKQLTRKRGYGIALGLGFALCLLPKIANAQATVNLMPLPVPVREQQERR